MHPIMKALRGSERSVIELTKGLVNYGYEVLIHSLYIAYECRSELKGKACLSSPDLTLGMDGFGATLLQYIVFPFTVMPILFKINKIDGVIAHGYCTLLPSILTGVVKKCKVIYICHDPPRFAYDRYEETKRILPWIKRLPFILLVHLLKFIDAVGIRYVDTIFVNSNYSARQMEFIYGLKTRVNYFGIDPKRFSDNRESPLRSDRHVHRKRFVLLSVGKLDPRKNLTMQLQLLKKLIDSGKEVFLIIIGDGPQRLELERLAKELEISDSVSFAGFVNEEELHSYYSACDIFLFTAHREPFGLVVVEAMAAGKPVVVPDEGGPPEIVVNGISGLIYRQGNLDDLYAKVEHLLENQEKRDEIGYNAKHRASQFTWDKACQILVSELISNKPTRDHLVT